MVGTHHHHQAIVPIMGTLQVAHLDVARADAEIGDVVGDRPHDTATRPLLEVELDVIVCLLELAQVFRQVFDDEELEVSPTTTAADIEGWDSLMHVRLVLSVEKAFQMRFSSSEVAVLKRVGDLVGLIVLKGKI